jgi:hypothetical protein
VTATSVEAVLHMLESAGFERLPKPLVVAGSSFDFDAAVKGTGVSHDLVLLATNRTPDQHLVRLVSALSRTLDQVDSRRPVSLVLLGDSVDAPTMTKLEQHARVLNVDGDTPDPDRIRRAIAVLLPLTLPAEQVAGRAPLTIVADKLGDSLTDEHLNFIRAAEVGTETVRDWLRQYIDGAVTGESSETDKT